MLQGLQDGSLPSVVGRVLPAEHQLDRVRCPLSSTSHPPSHRAAVHSNSSAAAAAVDAVADGGDDAACNSVKQASNIDRRLRPPLLPLHAPAAATKM